MQEGAGVRQGAVGGTQEVSGGSQEACTGVILVQASAPRPHLAPLWGRCKYLHCFVSCRLPAPGQQLLLPLLAVRLGTSGIPYSHPVSNSL